MIEQPIHMIGIGGVGMAPLAEIAVRKGLKVQGSDTTPSANIERLQQLNIPISFVQDGSELAEAKTVIISSAISEDNPELRAARQLRIPILHRSDLLARLMSTYKAITITGTHGKTTTSALSAYALQELGLSPTAAIGGELLGTNSSAMVGQGDFFVAEADESDGTFLKYRPFISVLTNVDADHLDHFGSKEKLQASCRQYLMNTEADGWSVVGWDSKPVREISEGLEHRRLTYGFSIGSEVRGLNYQTADGMTTFDVMVEHDLVKCTIPLMGRHNALNVLATLAVVRAIGGDVQRAVDGLSRFSGVRRRMQLVGNIGSKRIYDDYAHNPGKVAAALSGIRETWPHDRIIAIFQPHRYSRLQTTYDQMSSSFSKADLVIVLPIYAAGEHPIDGLTHHQLARDIGDASHTTSLAVDHLPEVIELIRDESSGRSTILTLGAGDVWKVSHSLMRSL